MVFKNKQENRLYEKNVKTLFFYCKIKINKKWGERRGKKGDKVKGDLILKGIT